MLSSFLVYTSTGQTQGTVGGSLNAASGSNGSLPGTHTVSFDVRLGEWTDLLLLYDLMAEARYRLADLGGVGHAEAWFEQSFFWNGILQIPAWTGHNPSPSRAPWHRESSGSRCCAGFTPSLRGEGDAPRSRETPSRRASPRPRGGVVRRASGRRDDHCDPERDASLAGQPVRWALAPR